MNPPRRNPKQPHVYLLRLFRRSFHLAASSASHIIGSPLEQMKVGVLCPALSQLAGHRPVKLRGYDARQGVAGECVDFMF
jgi:hypothetical protein